MAALSGTTAQPYPGPRTFRPEEHDRFFGREREARDLTALIVSERLVLFYSQSGAGKSSLINTKIIPSLAGENAFEVLPVGRVKGHSGFDVGADNIFIYNLLAGLHQRTPEPANLGAMSLSHFLDNLVRDNKGYSYDAGYEWPADAELQPRVLIIDQFEEIFTTNTAFWRQREEFFHQLGEALRIDERLWIVLAMREDFIANLDPYLHHLPGGLRHRYYMQQLRRADALKAIANPVADLRPFEKATGTEIGAAELLVNNLLAINDPRMQGQKREAQFVEPVQLQAVAYQLWEKLKARPGPRITRRDVEQFADVDKALISFYEDTIAQTIQETGVNEVTLRAWFEDELITDSGTRNMVFRGDEVTGSLPTTVADFVKSHLLVREIVRPAGIWYELIHDRFVQPVLDANRAWSRDQPLLQLAQRWAADADNPGLLLPADQLAQYQATDWRALGPVVARFMEASADAIAEQTRATEERQRAALVRRLRLAAVGAAVLVLVLGVSTLTTYLSLRSAQRQALIAQAAEVQSRADAIAADRARGDADRARADAESARDTAETARHELARQVAVNEALRLADKADEYLDAGRYDGALLLSALAERSAPTTRAEAALFWAANAGLADRLPTTAAAAARLRGEFSLPPDVAGPTQLFAGPAAGSLATLRDGDVVWWPAERPTATTVIEAGDTPYEVAAFATSHGLLAAASGTTLQLLQLDGGQWRPLLAGDPAASDAPITVLSFSPDGRRLAVAHCGRDAQDKESGAIEVWRIDQAAPAAGRPALELERAIATAAACARDVAVLDDSGRLAWAGATVTIEDPDGQTRSLSRLLPDGDRPLRLAAAANHQWLAVLTCPPRGSAAESTQIAAPQPVAGDSLACFPTLHIWAVGEEEPVVLLGFDADGIDIDGVDAPLDITYLPAVSKLVALERAGPATWWSADIAVWERQACALAGRNLTADEWREAFPERTLATQYEPVCDRFDVHFSVPETLVRQCDADGLSAAEAIWQGEGGLEAGATTTGFDEWAAAVLIKHLLTDFPVDDSDPCLGVLAGLDLPDDTPILQDGARRVVSIPAGDTRTWTFQGQAADVVTLAFAPLRVAGDALLTIRNARGAVVADNVNSGRELRLTLPAGGTYRLEIEPIGESPLVLSARFSPPREITLGETLAESNPEITRWRFTGQAGKLVTFDLLAPSGDPTLNLLDPSAVPLRFDDDGGEGLNSRITTFLPSNGIYTLDVGWIGEPQSYVLATSTVEPAILSPGESHADVPADRTMWQFDGQAGDSVDLALAATLGGDAALLLLDATGQEIFRADVRDEGESGPILTTFLPADGRYYARVEWLSFAPAETYSLSFNQTPAAVLPLDGVPQPAPAGQRSWRFVGQPGSFVTLVLTTTQTAPVFELFNGLDPVGPADSGGVLTVFMADEGPYTVRLHWPGAAAPYIITATTTVPETLVAGEPVSGIDLDRLLWRFTGQAGDAVRVDLAAAAPGAWLRLLDSANVELATGVEAGDFDLVLEAGLLAEGDYFLQILPGLDDPGNYNLSLSLSEAPLLQAGPAIEAEPEQRFWRYEGRAGDTVTITATTLEEMGDPVLRLYDAGGLLLSENDQFDGNNPQVIWTLPADEIYLIEVSAYPGTIPARYRILLMEE